MKQEAKVLSNILYIISKVGKVLSYILLGFMILFMVITPVLFRNIKIDKQTKTISLGNEEVYYSLSNNTFKVGTAEKEVFSVALSSKATSKVRGLLNRGNTFFVLLSEYIYMIGIVFITLVVLMLTRVERLFKNISEKTPFIKENVLLIQDVAKYLLIFAISMYVLTIVLQLIIGIDLNVTLDLSILIYVLVLYLLSYIFEYGIEKEK